MVEPHCRYTGKADSQSAVLVGLHRANHWGALYAYAEWAKRRIDELERIMKAKDELESARRHHYTARAEKAEARVAELEQQAEAALPECVQRYRRMRAKNAGTVADEQRCLEWLATAEPEAVLRAKKNA